MFSSSTWRSITSSPFEMMLHFNHVTESLIIHVVLNCIMNLTMNSSDKKLNEQLLK